MKDQIREDELRKLKIREADHDLARKNNNILINDEMRYAQEDARRQHYKDNLLDQIQGNQERKEGRQNAEQQEDDEFKRKMRMALEQENEKLRDIQGKKRKLFLDDIQRQLEDKERQKQYQQDINNAEDNNVKRKQQMEEDDYREKMFKKKQQM